MFTWLKAPLPRKRVSYWRASSDEIPSKALNNLAADYPEDRHIWVKASRLHYVSTAYWFVMWLFAFFEEH